MRYCFKNGKELLEGITLLSADLGIEVAKEGAADITVTVIHTEKRSLTVTLNGNEATIVWGDGKVRFFRGLAILVHWVSSKETYKTVTEKPLFKTNGAMVDMSRDAVMNVKTVKLMLRKMALMGLNTYMLYTEDTYEIKEYPYFGHLRGRYTQKEIRELDRYALTLGIELIPCVQMLGHLSTHLRWDAAGAYRDTSNAMLVGADATYELIDRMLKTIAECFTSRRLHVGMDETHDLGTGRYLEQNGYREREDIYFEHLEKITSMAHSYGFQPMMWSDMFFRLAGKDLPDYTDYDVRVQFSDEVTQKLPAGMQQVFWDYYHQDEDFYAVNLDQHHRFLSKDTLFAGGIWLWSGHCPLYSRSLLRTLPALEACRKKGVDEIFATIWLNGGEGNLLLGLAGLAWYADYDYKGHFDIESVKECFDFSCEGVSYDDMMKLELPEHPDGGMLGLTRSLLYNDPLVSLVDKHLEGLEVREYYRGVSKALESVGEMKQFRSAYDTIVKLALLLEQKTDFGIRLKSAYDRGDTEELRTLRDECDEIIEKLQALRASHRASWMEYYKPFGWEVHDIRYGGLIARFDTAKERLTQYLGGAIDRLEELEEVRLRMDGQLSDDAQPRFHGLFNWMQYQDYATASRL
ncbi:MAG: beta-N-acetylhexosaminidase [Clostridia bacterium]|nr:beta-N-acetylhexosaminidase [Clostridia bacterium]